MTIAERWRQFQRVLRFQYLRVMRQPGSAHYIAMGMAAGVFVGFLPIIPFQSMAALVVAFIVRGSKLAALAGTWVSNPVNMIPFYYMLYWVGNIFWHTDIVIDPHHLELVRMMEQGCDLVVVMSLGGLILGIPAAILAYVITFRAVNAYRQRRMITLMRRHSRLKG